MCSLQRVTRVGSDPFREERGEVVARADDHLAGADRAAAGLDQRRFDCLHCGLAAKFDPVMRREPGGEAWDRLLRFHPQFVRAPQPACKASGIELRLAFGQPGGRQQFAALAHLGLQEGVDHGKRLWSARSDGHATMNDIDAGRFGQFQPYIPRAHRAPPDRSALLAANDNEAEIADRGAIGLRVAVDHDNPETQAARRKRMRQPKDAGANDREVELLCCFHPRRQIDST